MANRIWLLAILLFLSPCFTSAQIAVGCFDSSSFDLGPIFQDIYMSQGSCSNYCRNGAHNYAITVDGSSCYCTNAAFPDSSKLDPSKCDKPCMGYPFEMCGGTSSPSVANVVLLGSSAAINGATLVSKEVAGASTSTNPAATSPGTSTPSSNSDSSNINKGQVNSDKGDQGSTTALPAPLTDKVDKVDNSTIHKAEDKDVDQKDPNDDAKDSSDQGNGATQGISTEQQQRQQQQGKHQRQRSSNNTSSADNTSSEGAGTKAGTIVASIFAVFSIFALFAFAVIFSKHRRQKLARAAWTENMLLPSSLSHHHQSNDDDLEGKDYTRSSTIMASAPMILNDGYPTPLPQAATAMSTTVNNSNGMYPMPPVLHPRQSLSNRHLQKPSYPPPNMGYSNNLGGQQQGGNNPYQEYMHPAVVSVGYDNSCPAPPSPPEHHHQFHHQQQQQRFQQHHHQLQQQQQSGRPMRRNDPQEHYPPELASSSPRDRDRQQELFYDGTGFRVTNPNEQME